MTKPQQKEYIVSTTNIHTGPSIGPSPVFCFPSFCRSPGKLKKKHTHTDSLLSLRGDLPPFSPSLDPFVAVPIESFKIPPEVAFLLVHDAQGGVGAAGI